MPLNGDKTLIKFVNNMYNEEINVSLINLKKAKEIYNNTIKVKKQMSISELLLKFLFFVIFVFKGDSVYINNIKEKEGFENINELLSPKTTQNKIFSSYFKNKYKRPDKKGKKRKSKKDGIFLFRDPYDPHYNSGQSFKENQKDIFYKKMKSVYYHLMETGSFKGINEL